MRPWISESHCFNVSVLFSTKYLEWHILLTMKTAKHGKITSLTDVHYNKHPSKFMSKFMTVSHHTLTHQSYKYRNIKKFPSLENKESML
jgi:hypothetical protein